MCRHASRPNGHWHTIHTKANIYIHHVYNKPSERKPLNQRVGETKMEREFVIRSLLQCSFAEQPKYTQVKTAAVAAAIVAAAAPSTATTDVTNTLVYRARIYKHQHTSFTHKNTYIPPVVSSIALNFSILHSFIFRSCIEPLCCHS